MQEILFIFFFVFHFVTHSTIYLLHADAITCSMHTHPSIGFCGNIVIVIFFCVTICTMHEPNWFCTKIFSVYYVSLPVLHQSFSIYNILFSQFILLTNQIITMKFHVNTSLTQMGPCTDQTKTKKKNNRKFKRYLNKQKKTGCSIFLFIQKLSYSGKRDGSAVKSLYCFEAIFSIVCIVYGILPALNQKKKNRHQQQDPIKVYRL